jgi:hypothetical protein
LNPTLPDFSATLPDLKKEEIPLDYGLNFTTFRKMIHFKPVNP